MNLPQTFQLFGLMEGIRSVENLKQQRRPKFFVQFCHEERWPLLMEWHPFQQLHSHIIPSGPGRMGPVFESLESSWEWWKQKILQWVPDLRIKPGFVRVVCISVSSLEVGASVAEGQASSLLSCSVVIACLNSKRAGKVRCDDLWCINALFFAKMPPLLPGKLF